MWTFVLPWDNKKLIHRTNARLVIYPMGQLAFQAGSKPRTTSFRLWHWGTAVAGSPDIELPRLSRSEALNPANDALVIDSGSYKGIVLAA